MRDASTSPPLFGKNMFLNKRKCSHIRGSSRRKRPNQGSFQFRQGSEKLRNGSGGKRSSSRSSSLQSYIFSFWPIIEENHEEELTEFYDFEDYEDEDDYLEPGCCNACWDKDIAWFESRARIPTATASKFRAFGGIFCLLGAGTFCLQQV